jgi:hypothetical protein
VSVIVAVPVAPGSVVVVPGRVVVTVDVDPPAVTVDVTL